MCIYRGRVGEWKEGSGRCKAGGLGGGGGGEDEDDVTAVDRLDHNDEGHHLIFVHVAVVLTDVKIKSNNSDKLLILYIGFNKRIF